MDDLNDGQEALEMRLGFLIHDVSRMRRIAFDQFMKPLGVTRAQWWVIAYLSRSDGITQTELAALLDISKVTLGGIIDRLETGDWVSRRSDPADRRIKRIFLSRQAEQLVHRMRSVEREHNDRILDGVSREQRENLSQLLVKVKGNLNDILQQNKLGRIGEETDEEELPPVVRAASSN